jgi:hypothetical protein
VFKNRALRQMFWTNGVRVDWRKCVMRSFTVCIPYQILQGHQVKENEMGRAKGKYGEEYQYIWGFVRGNLKDRDFLEGSHV